MSVARFVPLTVLLGVVLLAVSSLHVPMEFTSTRFDSRDFTHFKSRYEEMQKLPGGMRADLIRDVAQACEEAPMTEKMIEKVQIFSQTILHTKEEAIEVREQARKLIRILDARKATAPSATAIVRRTPASSS